MPSRRDIIKGMLTAGAAASFSSTLSATELQKLPNKRPVKSERLFHSNAIEAVIDKVKADIKDKKLSQLFENCFPNTLDTTVYYSQVDGKDDTFVITGDIEAMWLRDSCAQIWPYLPYVTQDTALQKLFRGVINRHAKSILIDPYANAFMRDPTAKTNLDWSTKDFTEMKPGVAERKWEIDSLCYSVRLSHGYWKATNDTSPFDETWQEAMMTVVDTFREQQRKDNRGPYKFQRVSNTPTETLPFHGYGYPTQKVGLIHSGFRPSDDACQYPFLIPSNHFAVVSLKQLAEMAEATGMPSSFRKECTAFAAEVEKALYEYAVIDDGQGNQVWAYEVDGYGNSIFMDDANIPSLLSLPYLGATSVSNALYVNTRQALWSNRNPYFFKGKKAEGVGGPHAGLDLIWPMSHIMKALTSNDDVEIEKSLYSLKTTDANTGFMHESFNKDDPSHFTRPWFAWANTLFGELILDIHAKKPHLLG